MKRKLAPEALYSSDHYHPHLPDLPQNRDESMVKATDRSKKFDPDRSKGLALLREIEKQSN